MPINWNTVEAKDRLFLATIAACDPKLDYRRIATFYGQGATYDSIEGQFRKIRNGAKELRAKVESGEIPVAPPRGSKTNPTTPRKSSITPREKIIGGRITKSNNNTPTKKSKNTKGFKEETESSASSFYETKSELETSTEDLANWNTGSQSAMEGGDFDFLYVQEEMEEGI
ncbi:hypothetical protein ACLMJK_002187 [Lecanora helva]